MNESKTKTTRTSAMQLAFLMGLLAVSIGAAPGCSDDEDTPNPIGGSDTGGPDTASDATADTRDGAPADTAVSTDASDTSVSDSADARETATDGGTAADCLSTTGANGFDSFFTLGDTSKCVVAQYTVEASYLPSLTWGRHGGPLAFDTNDPGAPKLARYKVPATATGTLTLENVAIVTSALPAGLTATTPTAYWGGQALDLPFFGWTAISYTGSGAGFPGEILLVGETSKAFEARYHVNGFFSESIAVASTGGRLIYTGLSTIGTVATATSEGALYAADSCGTSASSPRLLPVGDTTCKDPIKVASWEAGSSGPVATDPDQNVFAILSTFGGNQELRGFEKSAIARGAAATTGTKLFSVSGYTGDLVANGKIAVYQPNESLSVPPYSRALDVQAIDYKVDATAKTVTPSGTPHAFLTLKTADTKVALILDSSRRIWVGVTNPAPEAGAPTSTFFVLRDKTP